jgi:hypothetical protein
VLEVDDEVTLASASFLVVDDDDAIDERDPRVRLLILAALLVSITSRSVSEMADKWPLLIVADVDVAKVVCPEVVVVWVDLDCLPES